MKLSLEIELDWINDEMDLDETVKQNIIDSIVAKIEKKVSDQVTGKVDRIIDQTVVKKIDTMTENIFNDFMNKQISLTDNYGSKIKVYENVYALIKERFDNFMTQMVDDKGNTTTDNYYGKHKRLNYIIDKQLQDFAKEFTTNAVAKVSQEIKLHVSEGLKTKLGQELMNVLKVNEMLQLPPTKN